MTISPGISTFPMHGPLPGGTVEPGRPPVLRLVVLTDPATEAIGLHPRSLYVETFWLPVLGPSATWLLRHLVDELEASPSGVDLPLDDLARSLGLGGAGGRHSAFGRSIERCVHFGLARREDPVRLAVRCTVPPVPRRHLIRLPVGLQERHREWEAGEPQATVTAVIVRRTRLVALDLRLLGVDPPGIERHLQRRGVHPSLAYESARWAWSAAEDAAAVSMAQPAP
jgi:hypothetical protein